MAFMLGVSEYLLVYHTSSLTLSVAGVFKVGEEVQMVIRGCGYDGEWGRGQCGGCGLRWWVGVWPRWWVAGVAEMVGDTVD